MVSKYKQMKAITLMKLSIYRPFPCAYFCSISLANAYVAYPRYHIFIANPKSLENVSTRVNSTVNNVYTTNRNTASCLPINLTKLNFCLSSSDTNF
jgi:hypothetical protein